MLAGELYLAGGILPEHKSVHGKKIAQQINQTPIADKAKLKALVKQLLEKRVKITTLHHQSTSIMVDM